MRAWKPTVSPRAGSRLSSDRSADSGRIGIVEALRALAALSVAWFHFTNGNPKFLAEGWLKSSGTYGWVGVEVFFVVSGFIIPFTLYRRGYLASRHYFRFLAKRLLRLEPPYLACVLLSVLLAYVSAVIPGFRGNPPSFSLAQLALHVGYLVGFSDYAWVNPVFWSLAIEFQFYLVIGLLFPLLASERAHVRLLTLGALASLAFLPVSDRVLLPYLLIFCLGITTFLFRIGRMRIGAYLVASISLGVAIYIVNSWVVASASFLSALAIAFVRREGAKPLIWLGTISYSLYLLHVPVGGRLINLGERLSVGLGSKVIFLAVALGGSLVAATLYYRWLESPSKQWSSRIGYPETKREAKSPVDVMLAAEPNSGSS